MGRQRAVQRPDGRTRPGLDGQIPDVVLDHPRQATDIQDPIGTHRGAQLQASAASPENHGLSGPGSGGEGGCHSLLAPGRQGPADR